MSRQQRLAAFLSRKAAARQCRDLPTALGIGLFGVGLLSLSFAIAFVIFLLGFPAYEVMCELARAPSFCRVSGETPINVLLALAGCVVLA